MARARRGTPEWTARVGEGKRRAHEERARREALEARLRREVEAVEPVHIRRWLADGVVADELRPVVETRAAWIVELAQDLGGASDLTAAQRGLLDFVFKLVVAADATFGRFLRTNEPSELERLPAFVTAAANILKALGLKRQEHEIEDFHAYVARKDAESAATPAPSMPVAPNGSNPEPQSDPAPIMASGRDPGAPGEVPS